MNTLVSHAIESIRAVLSEDDIPYVIPDDGLTDDVYNRIQFFRFIRVTIVRHYKLKNRKGIKMIIALCDDMITMLIDHRDALRDNYHDACNLVAENRELKNKIVALSEVFKSIEGPN